VHQAELARQDLCLGPLAGAHGADEQQDLTIGRVSRYGWRGAIGLGQRMKPS
jgi:hypothetical protein